MFLNTALFFVQKIFKPVYERSFILKNIDYLIGCCILMVIFTSTFASSDTIGYFGIFAIILTVIKLISKPDEKFALTIGDKFLLVYFLIVIISVAGSSLFYLSLKGAFKTFTYLGFYTALIHYLKDNKNMIKYIFAAFALCTLSETVIAFMQNFTSVGEISGWQDTSRLNPEEVMTRVYGSLKPYNPNLFGGYMLACIPSALVLPFINKKTALPAILIFILSSAALVFTGCRGAYIGYFMQIIGLVLLTYKFLEPMYKKLFTMAVTGIFAIMTFVILSVSALRARVLSIFAMRSDSSNSFRFNVYNSCIQMFKDNWLLGIGVGNQNFREIYGLYMKTGFDALSAYNIYLEIAVESGIFALLAFIGFIGANIYKAVKFIFSEKSIETVYIIAALVSVIGILFHGIVDTVFFRPQIQFTFWIMIAIIRVITYNPKIEA